MRNDIRRKHILDRVLLNFAPVRCAQPCITEEGAGGFNGKRDCRTVRRVRIEHERPAIFREAEEVSFAAEKAGLLDGQLNQRPWNGTDLVKLCWGRSKGGCQQ